MKAIAVKDIFEELEKDSYKQEDGIRLTIKVNNINTYFTICDEDFWSIDVEYDLLILKLNNRREYIDTNSINMITAQ